MKVTTVLLVLAVAGAIYWLALFAPVLFVDHWEVKDKVNEVFKGYPASPSPEAARQTLVTKLGGLRFMTHTERNRLGDEVDVPGLATTDFNPYVFFDEVRRILLIRFEYDRVIRLWPTDKTHLVHLKYERKEDPFK